MMKKTPWLSFALLLGALCIAGPARGQDVVIKIGTLAPTGSPWHNLLKEAGEAWKAASNGNVQMRIFASGTMGNEGDMLKKMRIGQLQAAALTTIGLHEIAADLLAMDLPLLVQTTAEKDYLLEKIGPRLESVLEKKGYIVLNFSEIGFVRFFSTEKRSNLAEMQKGKLFVWEGDPASADAWKAGGFHPVVLSATDIMASLQTGMIDTVAYPPAVAIGYRMHNKAKFMTDLVWSSLTGALVIRKEAWEKVPANLRPPLMKIARDLGRKSVEVTRATEGDSIAKMKAQGLTEVQVTDKAAWSKAVADSQSAIRGKVVPAEMYDEVYRLVKEFRSKKAKQ